MRPGLIVSAIGHAGAVLITLLAWETAPPIVLQQGNVVPVEIVATADQSNVRALSAPDEDPAAAALPSEPEPTPAPTPAPQPPRPQRQQPDVDYNAIAAMLNRENQGRHERTPGAQADHSQRGVGAGTADVASMQDRVRAILRREMVRCWRAPIDLPDPERLVVTVQFDLDRNGHLVGQPRVVSPANYTFDPSMRTAVENALRAVRQCDPYPFADDPVVGTHFEIWRQIEHTFRPAAQ
ncbi:MAG: cell envelope integrity protein TolA [Pseudomonadota bacterium]